MMDSISGTERTVPKISLFKMSLADGLSSGLVFIMERMRFEIFGCLFEKDLGRIPFLKSDKTRAFSIRVENGK